MITPCFHIRIRRRSSSLVAHLFPAEKRDSPLPYTPLRVVCPVKSRMVIVEKIKEKINVRQAGGGKGSVRKHVTGRRTAQKSAVSSAQRMTGPSCKTRARARGVGTQQKARSRYNNGNNERPAMNRRKEKRSQVNLQNCMRTGMA